MNPPIKAPNIGTGIKAYPIKAPLNPEPTLAVVEISNLFN